MAPTELIPIPQRIEILLRGAEICQGVWADVGKPSTAADHAKEGTLSMIRSARAALGLVSAGTSGAVVIG